MRLFAPRHAPADWPELREELKALSECLARRGDRRGADLCRLAVKGLAEQRNRLRERMRDPDEYFAEVTAELREQEITPARSGPQYGRQVA